MEFDLSEDQAALRDAAAALLDSFDLKGSVRSLVGKGTPIGAQAAKGSGTSEESSTAQAEFDHELWEAMADQGWLAVTLPAAAGGLGLGTVELAVLCEQLGRRVAPAPYIGTVLALDALSGSSRHPGGLAQLREKLACGSAVGSLAWALGKGKVEVRYEGSTPLLYGRPDPALFAPLADVSVVICDDALFAVELAQPIRPDPLEAMDRTRVLGWIDLEGVAATPIGGRPEAQRMIDLAATATAAEMLGGAEQVLQMSVEYAKDRVQFGRPIGSFQAIKHRLADALVDVEAMRSSVYYAAWCAQGSPSERALAASAAKAWCSEAAKRVMASGLQVHGGIGFTWEHDLHLYMKRSQLDQVSFGDACWHRDRMAKILRAKVSSGESLF
ncbi:MAG: acyl-CoA/acyl-ACP dehydrogenase [Actinobacteria bacterium]|nr:acyl-CoA/acyl-ACP dehydrogenase [Actinomycetota bacterium]